jgi:hypothetical protein
MFFTIIKGGSLRSPPAPGCDTTTRTPSSSPRPPCSEQSAHERLAPPPGDRAGCADGPGRKAGGSLPTEVDRATQPHFGPPVCFQSASMSRLHEGGERPRKKQKDGRSGPFGSWARLVSIQRRLACGPGERPRLVQHTPDALLRSGIATGAISLGPRFHLTARFHPGFRACAQQLAPTIVEMRAIDRARDVRVPVAQQVRASSASSQSIAAPCRSAWKFGNRSSRRFTLASTKSPSAPTTNCPDSSRTISSGNVGRPRASRARSWARYNARKTAV